MGVSDVTNSAGQGQSGLWLLAVFLLGLSIMAWLTVREASLYETKAALKNLRRSRRNKQISNIPVHERVSFATRCGFIYRSLIRGGDIMAPFTKVVGEGEYGFEFRLRREIDKLAGKDVYHGQKEQL
jgi:hypothetical protein